MHTHIVWLPPPPPPPIVERLLVLPADMDDYEQKSPCLMVWSCQSQLTVTVDIQA